MRIHQICLISLVALVCTSQVLAGPPKEEHFDVWLRMGDSRLVTGAISEVGDPISNHHRVFGAEFGEDPGEPFGASEPGFQALDDTFASMAEFRINIMDAVTKWNGSGYSDADETMTLEFGPSNVTSGDGFVSGFTFTADTEGGFHDHFDILLNGLEGLRADPTPGIYLLPLQIEMTSGLVNPTRTFYFVMNLGQEEVDHEAAIAWVESNIPAPGVLLCFAPLAMRRRRARTA